MSKLGVFPGSFNPFHLGHMDVLDKALMVFDKVVIMQMTNTEKEKPKPFFEVLADSKDNDYQVMYSKLLGYLKNEKLGMYRGDNQLLVDAIKGVKYMHSENVTAVIKGLRNGTDLEYESVMQDWNEDLGIEIPTFYVLCDRSMRHISSSAVRAINKFKGTK